MNLDILGFQLLQIITRSHESGDSIPKLEIHALNDLNSEEWKPEKWVNMELCKFIRVEKKFESIDQLREQISEDKQTAIQWFQGK